MAAQTTALTEYADFGNSRTYVTSGSTVSKPKQVVQSRKVPTGNSKISEVVMRVSHATTDADGLVIPERVAMTATCRFPINGQTTDRDNVLVIFRDIVAGDEFGASVASGNWLV